MIEDRTHLLDVERGSAFDQHSLLFQSFDDGAVFNYGEERDLEEMFKRDGKARGLEMVLSLPARSATTTINRGKAPAEVHRAVVNALTKPASAGGMSTPLDLIIAQMTGAFSNRKAFFEKVWTVRDDLHVYDKIAWRPASTCAVSRDPKTGAFKGFRQMPVRLADTEEIKIGVSEAMVYIHGTHRNPLEGVSDMDIPYWCYQTKQKIRFLWYSFLEGQALPKTLVRHKDQTTADAAARRVAGLKNGGIASLQADIQVDAFESSGKGAAEFQAALRWLDSEASGSVLAGFTDLSGAASSGAGSYALAKSDSDFYLMSRQGVLKEMAACINHYMIADFVRFNFGVGVECPTFEFGPLQKDTAMAAMELLSGNASTNTSLPREFMDELVEKTAGYLEMDIDKVRVGLERAKVAAEKSAEQTAANPEQAVPVAGVAGAVGAAADAVSRANAGPAS